MASQSFSATVKSAKLDDAKKNILIDVMYGGGCGKHDFSLQVNSCMESYPVQCSAQLVHVTNDHCEALIHTTVVIPLAQYKLDTQYFKQGSLQILGDVDWQTNKASSAVVRLP
jgi:hypothetical protein